MNSGIRISNRQVIVFVAAIVLFGQVCLAKYSGGAGTSGAPYKIGTATDLLALGGNTDDYDANFVLTADIDLTGHPFTTAVIAPDTDNTNSSFEGAKFIGVFDGNSHTISNLTINTGGIGNNYLGLFGFVGSGGKIENLQLENFSITGGDGSAFIGGLAGEDAGTISNCFSESDVNGGNNSFYMGGLVGVEVNDGNIIDSYSAGTVIGDNNANYIGGLAGGIYGNGDINRCFSTSDVTGGNNSSYIGGLLGKNYLGSIVNCFSAGTVTNEANCMSVGGLVGKNYWGSIENCYSTDRVSVEVNNADIGGLVGTNLTYDDDVNFISRSYFLDTAGPNNGIGTLLTDTQMKQQASFAGWDFNSVWQISESLNYPELAWHFICTSPSAPTGVSATDGTYSDHIRVTWNSALGATGYEVWRGADSNSSLASKLGDSNTSPFDDSNVTAGTSYYYWVKAKNSCGTSVFSSPDSGYECPLPSVPASVSATDGVYNDHIRVTWTSASGATGYEVWRSADSNSSLASKLGDSNSPFDDSNVTAGTPYYYWVKAKNSCGTSGFSSPDSGYASCPLPSVPTGVSATDGTYSDHIRVTWNSASGATGYEVWRSADSNSSLASKLGDSNSPFDDYGVTYGTYYYWVKAKNSCGTSDFSSPDSGYATPSCAVPSAPGSVSATDGTYNDHIRVTWNSASGATGYEVWRNASSNSSGSASKLGDSNSPFDDYGVTSGTYYYWVKAKSSCGTSVFSLSASGYISLPCTVPLAPGSVSATDGVYNDHIRVTWTSASGATGYEVWRNDSNSSGSALKLGDYTSPFDDSGVTTGKTYYYWVKATNTCGTSSFSSSDSGYASCPVPSVPTNVSATDGTYNDHIRVTWTSASGATGYEVWRNDSNSSGLASKLGDSNTSPFDDSGVTTGKTYYYWVKAKNTCGTSGFSSSDSGYASPSCSTVPSAPGGVSATDGAYNDHIRVTWNSVSVATGYEVWRNTIKSSGSASKLGDSNSPFDDYGVTSGTYYYWVKAKNTCGTSDFSSSDSGYVSTNPQTVSITKCTVTAGSTVNSDKISFSGKMGATADDFNAANKSGDANFIEVIISSEDMAPRVFTFPVNGKTWKKGKFSSTITSRPSKMSFAFDTKKTTFSFSASNVDLTGLSCPVGIEIKVWNWTGTADVYEAVVNGKKPIPINLLMGVEDSLRVDGKPKFTKKSGVITQVAVSGGFSVENLNDANMATHSFSVTVGSQTFTIPEGNFKAGKNKFTCSKVKLYDSSTLIGIVSATFDFNKCTFTLTIKNTKITASGKTVFGIDFASFSGRDAVTLP